MACCEAASDGAALAAGAAVEDGFGAVVAVVLGVEVPCAPHDSATSAVTASKAAAGIQHS
jgi:hypothetical protein